MHFILYLALNKPCRDIKTSLAHGAQRPFKSHRYREGCSMDSQTSAMPDGFRWSLFRPPPCLDQISRILPHGQRFLPVSNECLHYDRDYGYTSLNPLTLAVTLGLRQLYPSRSLDTGIPFITGPLLLPYSVCVHIIIGSNRCCPICTS